ncbi:hypothetical protein [Chryseobacterium arthrosphaerae]|uniref:hypothetical protein n=1 Tax=Chryseobacterium arthrosphaerae TaxID=651561 RepID=UPI001E59C982|nr:hypothetical protein [Chryseobacterium arthrosphaerae]UEQ75131.1 hypothetical protein J8N07_15890 [Chryseobacterium arthrosphaerae]
MSKQEEKVIILYTFIQEEKHQHFLDQYLPVFYEDGRIPSFHCWGNYLKDHPVHFNISHSKDLAACAIAGFPLGLDVEFSDTSVSYCDFKLAVNKLILFLTLK